MKSLKLFVIISKQNIIFIDVLCTFQILILGPKIKTLITH